MKMHPELCDECAHVHPTTEELLNLYRNGTVYAVNYFWCGDVVSDDYMRVKARMAELRSK